MKIGVLGTGPVGRTISATLAEIGHDVTLGTRDVAATLARTAPGGTGGPLFAEWYRQHPQVRLGTMADAAAGDLIINCTSGVASLAALQLAGESNLNGKVLIDISNPLDFSQGMPPTLSVSNTDSLGEQIQRAFPAVRVVKTLNTVTASLMVDPRQLADGEHTMFVCGDDAAAKAKVTAWLKEWFGWKDVLDLGGITNARGMEMYLPLWLRLWGALGTGIFNVRVVK